MDYNKYKVTLKSFETKPIYKEPKRSEFENAITYGVALDKWETRKADYKAKKEDWNEAYTKELNEKKQMFEKDVVFDVGWEYYPYDIQQILFNYCRENSNGTHYEIHGTASDLSEITNKVFEFGLELGSKSVLEKA